MAIMPPTREYSPPLEAAAPSGIEFDLLDLLLVMAERKKTIILATVIGLFLAMGLVMLVHPMYTSKVTIMPPQQGQSSAALISQLGSLASLTGLGNGSGMKDPNDLYLAILQSDTIGDALIKRLDLLSVYHTKKLSEARRVLSANTKFLSQNGGLISITVKDGDPHRAAQIANAYVDELHAINSHLVIGEAGVRRLFFSQQLALEKDRLTDAEIALKETEEATGAVSPSGQTGLAIGQVAQLQSQIINHEVQLDTMRNSATDQNPDVVRLNNELQSLREQLRQMENAQQGKGRNPGDILLTPRALPADQLEFLRKQRDVQYHTLIFDLIARQFEAARLDEAKASPVIQVLDPAEPPDRKSSPFRALWVLIGAILGFIYGCTRVISSYVYSRVIADEVYAQKVGQFKRALRFRST
jgi:tyrosine-protein kinase Etk/Wzc